MITQYQAYPTMLRHVWGFRFFGNKYISILQIHKSCL